MRPCPTRQRPAPGYERARDHSLSTRPRQRSPVLTGRGTVGRPNHFTDALAGQARRSYAHGAASIGRFLLHAAEAGLLSEAADLAERAARTVGWGVRWANPTRCHGLAGNIEFLFEAAHVTYDRACRVRALEMGEILAALAQEQDDRLLCPSEKATVFSPDHMVGYAGVARCLLMLDRGEWWPEPVDVAWPRRFTATLAATAGAR